MHQRIDNACERRDKSFLATRHCNTFPCWPTASSRTRPTARRRSRLPLPVFQEVLKSLVGALSPDIDITGQWLGHRTFLLDGSSLSMPDTAELQCYFGQPRCQCSGCGFPVAKILALFHAGTEMLLDFLAAPRGTHEMSPIDAINPMLDRDDVLVGDRGFCSFAHLDLRAARGVQAVFCVHQKQLVDFTRHRQHARAHQKKASTE